MTPRLRRTSTASCLSPSSGAPTLHHRAANVLFSLRYLNPLLSLGLKRRLTSDDLPSVSSADQAKLGVKLLDEHWSYERSLTALDPSLYRSLCVVALKSLPALLHSHPCCSYAAFCGPYMLNALWKLPLDLFSFLQPCVAPARIPTRRSLTHSRRYFLRSILKELNTDKEAFELGKTIFYIFMLFLVQLLQSVFVGRYLCATLNIPPRHNRISLMILQIWCVPQLGSRQKRSADHDLPQDPHPER